MEQYGVVKGLSEGEISKLAECEGIIRRGIKTFVEVGDALLTIRDQRLYREQFKTFEAYCREQWGFSRSHADRRLQLGHRPSASGMGAVRPRLAGPRTQRDTGLCHSVRQPVGTDSGAKRQASSVKCEA